MFEITFLGTSGSIPTKTRGLPSIAIRHEGLRFLLDCGEGAQRALIYSNFRYTKINKIFLTHLHGDHILGIPALIQTLSFLGRKDSLEIYGPPGTSEFINLCKKLGYFTLTFDIYVYELSDDGSFECNDLIFEYTLLEHSVPNIAYSIKEKDRLKIKKEIIEEYKLGYEEIRKLKKGESISKNGKKITPEDACIEVTGKKIVYSGDCRPSKKLVELAKNADVLIHDATFTSDLEDLAREYYHSTAREAAKIAKEANVKLLVLFHISQRYAENINILINEARKIFDNTIVSEEYMTLKI